MKKIARTLSAASLVSSSLTLFPRLSGTIGAIKVLAGGLTPLTTLLGGVGAALGAASRDPVSVSAGVAGAAISASHIHRTTRPHTGFEAAFGPDWQAQIPDAVRRHWMPERWSAAPLSTSVSTAWTRDIPFARVGDILLFADLWQPVGQSSGLGIVAVHGGAFHYGTKDAGTRGLFNHLAQQGHTILDINYRLPPEGYFFEQVADVKRAIAWLRARADGLGIERVALVGYSAGAHLALTAAYTSEHPDLTPADLTGCDLSVSGVAASYPPADFNLYTQHWAENGPPPPPGHLEQFRTRVSTALLRATNMVPEGGGYVPINQVLHSFLQGTPAEVPARYKLASPVDHVSTASPPTLLLHGEDDRLVSVEHSRNLHSRLVACGVPSVHVTFPRSGHAFDQIAFPISPSAQSALYDVERFFSLIAYGGDS